MHALTAARPDLATAADMLVLMLGVYVGNCYKKKKSDKDLENEEKQRGYSFPDFRVPRKPENCSASDDVFNASATSAERPAVVNQGY